MPSLDDLYRKIYLYLSFAMYYPNFKLALEKSGTKFLTNFAIFLVSRANTSLKGQAVLLKCWIPSNYT